jgi:hypothetical protein
MSISTIGVLADRAVARAVLAERNHFQPDAIAPGGTADDGSSRIAAPGVDAPVRAFIIAAAFLTAIRGDVNGPVMGAAPPASCGAVAGYPPCEARRV